MYKAPLNNLLTELSRSNIDLLSSGNQEKTNETVKKILDSSYFQNSLEDRRASYDCHARFKCSINEGPELKISSTYPLCFAPIPNENYFYCRGNLTEATKVFMTRLFQAATIQVIHMNGSISLA